MSAAAVLAHFDIPREKYTLTQTQDGLINRSYKVAQRKTGKVVYFLQKIDHDIFKDVEGLMQNIAVVTRYFATLDNPPPHLQTIATHDGKNYYHSPAEEYWRLYHFVNGKTYHRAENTAMAGEAGRMFGQFLGALSTLDIDTLVTTIPRFHDIDLRYEQFQQSLATASSERLNDSRELITLVEESIAGIKDIYHTIVAECPARTTHNDTKLSNLLFDNQQKGICVTDYDTLMPGYWPLDFGDSIRTLCSTTVEDDTDLANTRFEMRYFAAFARHFIEQLGDNLTASEITLLPRSVPYMPFLMGLRMLTDYLNNDVYYTTQYPTHNLVRAKNQLQLYKSGMVLQEEMNSIVDKFNS